MPVYLGLVAGRQTDSREIPRGRWRHVPTEGTFPSHTPAMPDGHIPDVYADRVRVRVGALLFDDDAAPGAVLLAQHDGLWEDRPFWTPPGGGVEFGEGLAQALQREVSEETGVDVEVGPLRYVVDFVRPPLHAVSFYFSCRAADLDAAKLGTDPELGDRQMLRGLRLVPLDELASLTLYPEPFAGRLAADARAGFPDGTVYLGTAR